MTDLAKQAQDILSQIYIAVPYHRLVDEFFDLVMKMEANLELGMHAEGLDRFSRADFQSMARKFEERSIKTTMHAAFMDINPGSLEPLVAKASQSRVHQVLDLVEVFRPRTVVCHLGYIPVAHSEVEEQWMANTIEFWSSLAPKVGDMGTMIVLENVFELKPVQMKTVVEAVNSPHIRYCFDTGHTLAFSRTSWEEWLSELQPYLAQIHVHDNAGQWDEHRAVGKGIFPFQDMFPWLKEQGLKPIITLEAHSEQGVYESLPALAALWPWE